MRAEAAAGQAPAARPLPGAGQRRNRRRRRGSVAHRPDLRGTGRSKAGDRPMPSVAGCGLPVHLQEPVLVQSFSSSANGRAKPSATPQIRIAQLAVQPFLVALIKTANRIALHQRLDLIFRWFSNISRPPLEWQTRAPRQLHGAAYPTRGNGTFDRGRRLVVKQQPHRAAVTAGDVAGGGAHGRLGPATARAAPASWTLILPTGTQTPCRLAARGERCHDRHKHAWIFALLTAPAGPWAGKTQCGIELARHPCRAGQRSGRRAAPTTERGTYGYRPSSS